MRIQLDDGGRASAGFKGKAGDCVVRAVAIATGRPYAEVYAALSDGMASNRKTRRTPKSHTQRSAENGVTTRRKWFKDYMKSLGWEWVPTMGIGTGCKVHLREDELPKGHIIARVSRHYTAVIDGVIHDTHNPTRDGSRCVYGFWREKR